MIGSRGRPFPLPDWPLVRTATGEDRALGVGAGDECAERFGDAPGVGELSAAASAGVVVSSWPDGWVGSVAGGGGVGVVTGGGAVSGGGAVG